MPGPATQAAANVQAIESTLRGAVNQLNASGGQTMTPAQAAAAVTANDWTVATGSYNAYVYDKEEADTTWTTLFAGEATSPNPVVHYNRSVMKAPYGGGNAGTQFD